MDALLFFGPRGPKGLSKGSFNVTSLTIHNVHITYNRSSPLRVKHKIVWLLRVSDSQGVQKGLLKNSYIKRQKRRNIVEMVNSSIGPLKKICQILEYNAFCMRFSKRMFSVSEHVLTYYVLLIDIQIISLFYFAHNIYFSTFQIMLPWNMHLYWIIRNICCRWR